MKARIPYIDVAHLGRYAHSFLLVSTILFILSVFSPGYDPFYATVVVGVIVTIGSYFITASAYFRQLFTCHPQKISMIKSLRDIYTIEIFPYILDRRNVRFYLRMMELEPSHNYDLVEVLLNGNPLSESSTGNSIYIFPVQELGTNDSKFVVMLRENHLDVTARFLRYTLYYSGKEKSRLLRFKEEHSID